MEMLKVLHSLDPQLEQFYDVFIPVLLKICERTNRVFILRATDAIQSILNHPQAPVSKLVVPHLVECMSSASKSLRLASVKTLTTWITVHGYVEEASSVEAILLKGFEDAAGEIREACRDLYRAYTERWPERKEMFSNILPPTTQKVLNLAPAKKVEHKPLKAFLAPYGATRQIQNGDAPKATINAPQRIVNMPLAASSVASSQPASRPSSAVRVPVRTIDLKAIDHTLPMRKLEFKPTASQDSAPKRVLPHTAKPTESKVAEVQKSSILMKKSISTSTITGASSIGSAMSVDVDYVQILKNGTWSEKCDALDALGSNGKIQKLDSRLEAAMVECLGDTHYRVLQSAVDSCVHLFPLISHSLLEEVLLKFSAIWLNCQFRTKPQLISSCESLRNAFRKRLGTEEFLGLLCGVQMRPDVAGNVKLRTVLTGFVSKEILAFDGELKGPLVKLVAMRMSIPLSDHDEALAQATKGVFAALKQTMPEAIYWGSVVPAVKSTSGRQKLRELEAVKPVPRDGHSHIPVRSPPKSLTTAFYPGQLVTPLEKIFAPVDEEISFKLRHTRLGSS